MCAMNSPVTFVELWINRVRIKRARPVLIATLN